MPAFPSTLYAKLWNAHLVADLGDGQGLIYIDRQLLHEVSSPQAFVQLREKHLPVRRPEAQLGLIDHAVPTLRPKGWRATGQAGSQIDLHARNCAENGIRFFGADDDRQGIVHVVGPEQGFTLPGITLVCGDSHTATHGAFGALAFGIGASEVACVLANQVLIQQRMKTMSVTFDGRLPAGVTAKDMILALIARIGSAGATGHAIEYRGEAVRALSMEARMTLCNMTIEAGSRVGLIQPDDVTFDYVRGRNDAPAGADWDRAVAYWRTLRSDDEAQFDEAVAIDASGLSPMVTWGTSPDQAIAVSRPIPEPASERDRKALDYMRLRPGQQLSGVAIDAVFIGSCTNGRIEDLRAAAKVLAGQRKNDRVQALVVPGSEQVRLQAEREGLDRIFLDAGFEWRSSGCSLCVAMNDDRLQAGQRCASTSNRNFEGRQGAGALTHLMSPAMAAAAAVAGHITDLSMLDC